MEARRRRVITVFWVIALAILTFMVCVPHATSASDTSKKEVPVILIEDIDEESVAQIENKIAAAKTNGADKVVFRIFSGGGNLFAGLKMINIVRNSGLHTACELEVAMSMAAIFFESPACKERIVRHGSVLMFHQAHWKGAAATGDAHQQAAVTLKTMDRALASLIAPRMGMTTDTFLAKIEGSREWWLAGEDIIEAKAADRLVE